MDDTTAVAYAHSPNFTALLAEAGLSLLISTYQAGKVIAVGTHEGALVVRFHHFEQAMGMARTPTGLAIGTKRQIWFLNGRPDLAPRIAPAGHYDVAFLTQHAHYTGPIMGHEMAHHQGELWFLNTLFSCLCVVQPEYHFVPRWKPSFIDALASEDRCHLNGLALDADGPRWVTCLGETNTPRGWRERKANGGCLLDVSRNAVAVRGLAMPHSPRVHRGAVWLLNSGMGHLSRVDPARGTVEPVAALPGYTRGLDCHGSWAFVGLSRIRESNVFGGLPIAEHREELVCGVAIVDLDTGRVLGTLQFHNGVEEIFDVTVLPGFRNPYLSGPLPDVDDMEPIWLVPATSSMAATHALPKSR